MLKDVTLCKDCMFREERCAPLCDPSWYTYCTLHQMSIDDDGYCSDAVPKRED